MENGWSLFNNNSSSTTIGSSRGGQNGHCTTTTTSHNLAWELWDLSTARFDWSTTNHNNSLSLQEPPPAAADGGVIGVHALMAHPAASASSLYAGAGSHYHPDPHLVCLNLGKRHYFEDATLVGDRHVDGVPSSIGKRGRPVNGGGGGYVGPAAVTVAVPRCQVDGCHVALLNAKEYHRRHKVCEMHSKAPKVVVLGADQRFCQQCSRFHSVSEFDESKRSCRRRLAGHNERRRKGSHDHIIPKNPCQGRALSLLSSKSNTWFSSSADLSNRCSAALGELIAENRAANLARQLVIDREWPINQHHHSMEDADPNGTSSQNHLFSGWDRYNEGHGGHVTLDLMQAQNSAFGLLSVRGKSKDEEEEGCSEFMWRSLGGSHQI